MAIPDDVFAIGYTIDEQPDGDAASSPCAPAGALTQMEVPVGRRAPNRQNALRSGCVPQWDQGIIPVRRLR